MVYQTQVPGRIASRIVLRLQRNQEWGIGRYRPGTGRSIAGQIHRMLSEYEVIMSLATGPVEAYGYARGQRRYVCSALDVKGYPSLGTSSHGSIFTVEIPQEALNPASGYPGAKDPSRWVSTRMEPYLWDPATESAWPDRCFWTVYASLAPPAVLRAKNL
jgi:hypothetical protein